MMICPRKDIKKHAALLPGIEDAHMPGRHLDVPNDSVKVVVKLKV